MSFPHRLDERGFSLIDILLMLGLISIGMAVVLSYVGFTTSQNRMLASVSTRDRIWSGIRMMAAMPAALRNSARASLADGTTAVNPELRNCVNGLQKNQCLGGQEFGFSLYSPVLTLDADGNPVSIQQVTAALGGTPLRIDTTGSPCQANAPGCVFLVYSSFKPHCAPQNLPPVLPANLLSPNVFASSPTCTVADYLEVKFFIEVAADLPGDSADLVSAIAGKSGSVFLSVKKISGNDPQ